MEFKREHHANFLYVLAVLTGVLLPQSLISQREHIRAGPYREFQQLASQGKRGVICGQWPMDVRNTIAAACSTRCESGRTRFASAR